ncbi:MAG: hypothetical protein JWQ17_5854 [Tardiphaga sp.]|jgi:hypothetical protein|nr:hypothetical protein [Tardiphaga sp.]
MAVNKPVGDNARKGAVKKRSQTRTKMGKAKTWTKRDKTSGEFMAVKKSSTTKSVKKFKGRRRENRFLSPWPQSFGAGDASTSNSSAICSASTRLAK